MEDRNQCCYCLFKFPKHYSKNKKFSVLKVIPNSNGTTAKDIYFTQFGITFKDVSRLCTRCFHSSRSIATCIKKINDIRAALIEKRRPYNLLVEHSYARKAPKKPTVKRAKRIESHAPRITWKKQSIKSIQKGQYSTAFKRMALGSKKAKAEMIKSIKSFVRKEVMVFKAKSSFSHKKFSLQQMFCYDWVKLIREAKEHMPILFGVLLAAFTRHSQEHKLNLDGKPSWITREFGQALTVILHAKYMRTFSEVPNFRLVRALRDRAKKAAKRKNTVDSQNNRQERAQNTADTQNNHLETTHSSEGTHDDLVSDAELMSDEEGGEEEVEEEEEEEEEDDAESEESDEEQMLEDDLNDHGGEIYDDDEMETLENNHWNSLDDILAYTLDD